MLAVGGQRHAPPGLDRGDDEIGQRPRQRRLRRRQHQQFGLGAGGAKRDLRARRAEQAKQAAANRVEPARQGQGLFGGHHPRQRRLAGGVAPRRDGGGGRGRQPDFVFRQARRGRHSGCARCADRFRAVRRRRWRGSFRTRGFRAEGFPGARGCHARKWRGASLQVH